MINSKLTTVLGQLTELATLNAENTSVEGQAINQKFRELSRLVDSNNPTARKVFEKLRQMHLKHTFIAALHESIQKASEQPDASFNVETAINDLWIALDKIRHAASPTSTHTKMADMKELHAKLLGIMGELNEVQKKVVQNMR